MTDESQYPGAWVKDSQTAIDLINLIEWRTESESMRLLHRLTMVAIGQREKVRFVVEDSVAEQDEATEMTDTQEVGWFDALGHEIPPEQREAAIKEAQRMGMDADADTSWVDTVATFVADDKPDLAFNEVREHFDTTGTYRFLAALCTPVGSYDVWE